MCHSRGWRIVLAGTLVAMFASAGQASPTDQTRSELYEIERDSHQLWLDSDLDALGRLMAEEFHFVAMNGAVETKADVLGTGEASGTRPMQVRELRVEPQQFIQRGNVATVISLMHLDATVRERTLPPRMRVLSVFVRDDDNSHWQLLSRSITPLLAPPPGAPDSAPPAH